MDFIVTAQPGKYFIDRREKPVITLQKNEKRCFDQSNPSNQNHPLRFSATSNGTWGDGVEYTNGVRVSGTPGTPNAQVCWTVPPDVPNTMYYYCKNHAGMGNTIKIE